METVMTPLKVFITGATDALGREVTRQLVARGCRVAGMTQGVQGAQTVRQDGGIPVYGDSLRAGEIKSAIHMAEADVVMHLAAQHPNHIPQRSTVWDERVLLDSINAVLEAAKGVKFLIYPSYAFLYGDTHGEWVDESAPRLKPRNNVIFRAALEVEDRVLNSGVPACILRAGFVYGAEGDGNLAFRESLRQGKPLVISEGHTYSNWIYAGDLASAAIRAAERQPSGAIFNVVDDEPVSPATFVDHFAERLGLSRAVRLPSRPAFASRNATTEMQRALWDMSLRVKNDRAKTELGWTPRYPTYREGIEQTLLMWRAEQAAES
jgi:nucleoside-diphosphate-sugar epimerase